MIFRMDGSVRRKRAIIADDFGRSHDVNRAIAEAFDSKQKTDIRQAVGGGSSGNVQSAKK